MYAQEEAKRKVRNILKDDSFRTESDNDIIRILKQKGEIEIFEKDYKAFTTGKSDGDGNAERIFYCKVTK